MPNPDDYDNQDEFISDCISERQDEHPDEDVDQSAAICHSMWDERAMHGIVHKIIAKASSSDDPLSFVLSDATVDRYGDTIDPNGWVLENFTKNPIALFNHRSDFPIGSWSNIRVEDNALKGHLTLAPKGSSERIDELRSLISAGILRAVSVGFVPLDSTAIKDAHGYYVGERYIKQELVETSLVSVPANPNAVLEAKRLKISDDTINVVFRQVRQDKTDDTIMWAGQRVPVKRYPVDSWRGQKIYRADY
jgi:HK97 family phage prohead protease